VGGPQRFRFDEIIGRALSAKNDKRKVTADAHTRYFGTELSEESLVTGDNARIGQTQFDTWLSRSSSPR
jgi:hypothetical protein